MKPYRFIEAPAGSEWDWSILSADGTIVSRFCGPRGAVDNVVDQLNYGVGDVSECGEIADAILAGVAGP